MDDSRRRLLGELAARLGLGEMDPGLIDTALTHGSYANESGVASNERLEFLGDAVIGLAIADALYRKNPEATEGTLAKRRAVIVSAETLAEHAQRLELGRYLLLSKGEELTGGRERQSLLSDAFEALVGAAYLSCGPRKTKAWVVRQLEPSVDALYAARIDHKTTLQEALQAKGRGLPVYRSLGQEGPDHQRIFTVGAYLDGQILGTGTGPSKKSAEQEAARSALIHIRDG